MSHTTMKLPADPKAALQSINDASKGATVLVFKKSPICPVSFHAEAQFRSFLADRTGGAELKVAEIDVIAEKPLARGLTAELGIAHQSPQALVFRDGVMIWHDSHDALTVEAFEAQVG